MKLTLLFDIINYRRMNPTRAKALNGDSMEWIHEEDEPLCTLKMPFRSVNMSQGHRSSSWSLPDSVLSTGFSCKVIFFFFFAHHYKYFIFAKLEQPLLRGGGPEPEPFFHLQLGSVPKQANSTWVQTHCSLHGSINSHKRVVIVAQGICVGLL